MEEILLKYIKAKLEKRHANNLIKKQQRWQGMHQPNEDLEL